MKTPIDNGEGRRAQMRAFFSTPIWKFEWEWGDQLHDMSAVIKRQMAADPARETRSDQYDWQSDNGLWRLEEFALLRQRAAREVHRINADLQITDGWGNVNFPGSFNHRHIFPESVLAGIFYVEVPKNSGDLVLKDPRVVAEMVGGLPAVLTAPVRIEPKAGMLVLLPAWLPHSVEENESDQNRISIAFNTSRTIEHGADLRAGD